MDLPSGSGGSKTPRRGAICDSRAAAAGKIVVEEEEELCERAAAAAAAAAEVVEVGKVTEVMGVFLFIFAVADEYKSGLGVIGSVEGE